MVGFSMDVYAPRRPVDNRLSLRIYFRTADNILKQANIYRGEANLLELYILLLRYASLVSETIPQHRQYRDMNFLDKTHLKRKLGEALQELETLKPGVQVQIRQKNMLKPARPPVVHQAKNEPFPFPIVSSDVYKTTLPLPDNLILGLPLPTPSAETLARHSFLNPLSKSTTRVAAPLKVQYPRLLENAPAFQAESCDMYAYRTKQDSVAICTGEEPDAQQAANRPLSQYDLVNQLSEQASEPPKLSELELMTPSQFDLVNMLFTDAPDEPPRLPTALVPPPVPAPVQTLDITPTEPPDLSAKIIDPKQRKNLHMSFELMEEFLRVAKANTRKSLETCGILAGKLQSGTFSVTALIIPKQDSTSNTCEAKEEVEIFAAQDKRDLFQLGWIHTHPTQSCFMSSVDIHTHYSYQVMLPEAIAIVMAPQDTTSKYGMFRLSDPGGMNVIRECPKRGFHGHDNPSDGSCIYEKSSHVFLDSKVGFEVIDLRTV